MKKTLRSIGNSLGLIIDKPILELLGIDKETPLKLSTDGTRLIIEPDDGRFERTAEGIMDRHAAMFEKLAE